MATAMVAEETMTAMAAGGGRTAGDVATAVAAARAVGGRAMTAMAAARAVTAATAAVAIVMWMTPEAAKIRSGSI